MFFSLLGFVFIIILVILLFGLSLIGNIIRFIFGGRRNSTDHSRTYTQNRSANNHTTTQTNTQNQRNTTSSDPRVKERKKIFNKDEGEYVDFEEVE